MPTADAKAWYKHLQGKVTGKYTLLDFIGAGNIGYVYRARHKEIEKCVRAVKLVFDKLNEGWQVELEKVSQLQLIDGVVHFHEDGTETLTHNKISHFCQYTVWDYIPPGENLSGYLKRQGRIPTSFLIAVVERVLHVLNACEAQGIVRHGDLHSGNILIGDQTIAKLDDSLQPRAPIYVSDFGYGLTGGAKLPRDDYEGLATIINPPVAFLETLYRSEALAGLGLKPVEPRPANLTSGDF